MKKILTLIAVIMSVNTLVKAQDDISKKVRFGIRATPAINWMAPDNDKKIKRGGAVMKAGLGLQLEFKITEVAWFQTGVEYTGAGFKADYQGSDTAMYLFKDDELLEANIIDNGLDTNQTKSGISANHLLTRKYKIGYIHIPLCFKFKTKDIGGLTYFGNIGGNIFFKTGAKANDVVNQYDYGTMKETKGVENNKVDIGKTVNLLTMAANVGGGVEYNLSGSTSLFASIGYQYHFMNATKKDSGYLIRGKTEGGTYKISEFPNPMKLRQIVLAVGILF